MTGSRPAVHQLSVSAAYGDAIGGEVFQIRDALREAGYESDVFVERVDRRVAAEVRPHQEYREVSHPDNTILLHFSMGSKVSGLARSLPDRLILKYHNITPAEWFAPYHSKIARNCMRGRRELATLVERTKLALGDSEFNRRELEELGFSPTAVLPLIMDMSRLEGPRDRLVLERYRDDRANLLYVGRIAPNKCIEDLLRAFAYYKRYVDHRARLIIVGDYRSFAAYYDALQHLAAELGLDEATFAGHVSQAALNACYEVADCFLLASEHEGFCVPVFEAMYSGLPVIGYSAAALPYSTGRGILLLEDKEPAIFAETIAEVLDNHELRERLLRRQRQALQTVDREALVGQLLEHLATVGVA